MFHTLFRVQIFFFSCFCFWILGAIFLLVPEYPLGLKLFNHFFTKFPPRLCYHISLSSQLCIFAKRVNDTRCFYSSCCVCLYINYSLFWIKLLILQACLILAPKVTGSSFSLESFNSSVKERTVCMAPVSAISLRVALYFKNMTVTQPPTRIPFIYL